MQCKKCGKTISAGDEYRQGPEVLCEDCYMDLAMPRTRKTHWQYLSCIKTQYLRKAE